MERTDLTQYDIKPEYMVNYLRYYGPHFNEKLIEFAVSKMYKREEGAKVKLVPYTKRQVEEILKAYKIELKNDQLYDSVFVANMAKADYWGSSITDEMHLAKYIKDVIDDVDGYDGIVFNRWYADMCKKGIVIDWKEMI